MDFKRSAWYKMIVAVFIVIASLYLAFLIFFNSGSELPVLDQAEPFTLQDVNRDTYNSSNRKIKLLAFFYTNCPDICPLTMMDFKILQGELKEKELFSSQVELVAITLDPEVDSFEVIAEYAGNFDADPSGWKFLRGSEEQTSEIARSYHMKYKKAEGDYIAHNTTMFIVDSDNRIRGMYDMANSKKAVDKEKIMEDIMKLVGESE